MNASRPDICSSLGVLSQFTSNPSLYHWQGIQRIFRYLKGTLDYRLTFDANDTNLKLHGYADANWAGDNETRRSTPGYLLQLAGSTVSWRSQRQSEVALSTKLSTSVSVQLHRKLSGFVV